MNDQFLQGVLFDWNRIDNDSYLKRIKAFKGIQKLDFNKAITFFVGENGSGKSTLLKLLMRIYQGEGEILFDHESIENINSHTLKRIMFFLRMIHIQNCVMR